MNENSPPNDLRRRLSGFLPTGLRRSLARRFHRLTRRPVRFGSLRRTTPLSRQFGFDRGQPIDRYYIEGFLEENAELVRGRVLEIGTDMYTRRFGADRVSQSSVLHVSERKPGVTHIGDLCDPSLALPDDGFDCILLTQVLHFIFDVPAALRTVDRLLAPGGVLLLTEAGITPASCYDVDRWGEYWRFTSLSIERLLAAAMPDTAIEVQSKGNVLSAAAFLYGIAADELTRSELDEFDRAYEVLIAAKVTRG